MTNTRTKKLSFNSIVHFFSNPSYGVLRSELPEKSAISNYGVVNEREVRVVAGFMFAIGLMTMLYTIFTRDFSFALVIIPLFLTEFLLKVLIGPQASYIAVLMRPLISHLEPEWVGAIQKRFAWFLGAIFASLVLFLITVMKVSGLPVLLLCSLCLLLMWLESAAGICLGCNMYSLLVKRKIIPALTNGPKCSGGVCEI
jgi:hypothetical protein